MGTDPLAIRRPTKKTTFLPAASFGFRVIEILQYLLKPQVIANQSGIGRKIEITTVSAKNVTPLAN